VQAPSKDHQPPRRNLPTTPASRTARWRSGTQRGAYERDRALDEDGRATRAAQRRYCLSAPPQRGRPRQVYTLGQRMAAAPRHVGSLVGRGAG
jgi:hypothetical protein